ncbi:MAG: vWA domain-containing protein [Sandaracinaceae bacterium]
MTGSAHRPLRRIAIAALVTAAVVGCGARTGLDAPPIERDAGMDGGLDAGVDAGPPPRPCVEVPRELGEVVTSLDIPASLAVIDLMFLIDSTGSMRDEIDAVRNRLRGRVVPGVRAAIPDAAFGVALFGEFPVRPHGPPGVRPYELRSILTTDVATIEAALDETPTWGNFDDPEAAIEGLFQVITGEGYGSPGDPGFIPASAGCPSGGSGGACFRPDALPIVMLITDAPMHNGPSGDNPYSFSPAPHTYRATIDRTIAFNALVVGLAASDSGRPPAAPDLRQLARDTGSVDGDGQPLFFDIGSRGDRIGDEIVSAVQFVASEVPLDVDALADDLPGDGVDANDVLRGVRARSAEPMSNVERLDGDTFFGVIPGTTLTFELLLDASMLPPSPTRRVYTARITFRASGRSLIGVREVDIVVPGDDGMGCE